MALSEASAQGWPLTQTRKWSHICMTMPLPSGARRSPGKDEEEQQEARLVQQVEPLVLPLQVVELQDLQQINDCPVGMQPTSPADIHSQNRAHHTDWRSPPNAGRNWCTVSGQHLQSDCMQAGTAQACSAGAWLALGCVELSTGHRTLRALPQTKHDRVPGTTRAPNQAAHGLSGQEMGRRAHTVWKSSAMALEPSNWLIICGPQAYLRKSRLENQRQ